MHPNHSFKMTYYKKQIIILLVALMVMLMFISSIFYIDFVKKTNYENAYDNMSEISKATATQLNLTIYNQMKFVEIMVDFINGGYVNTTSEIFKRFAPDLKDYHFTRLVILDKNGNGITSDGHKVTNYENIEEFFQQDQVYLSENRKSTVEDQQVNIYSKTFEFANQELVLFATINTTNYQEIVSRRLFDGKGGTYLINKEGLVLIDSFGKIKNTDMNFYTYLEQIHSIEKDTDKEKINHMKAEIKKGNIGTFDMAMDNKIIFFHYEKLNVNDWYVITVAPDTAIAKKMGLSMGSSLFLCLLINLIIISIVIYIYTSNQKKNKKLYKAAYIDSITNLANEFYLKEQGNKFLQDNKQKKYVMVIDIDNFKNYNKIYGYEISNEILKRFGNNLINNLPKENITCRISRDIFVSVFISSTNIEKIINNLCQNLENLKVDENSLHINFSIGIYPVAKKDTDINKALDKAYMAHASIKGIYNEKYRIFDESLEKKLLEEQKIESDMEQALEDNEFKVFYQPKISTKTKKLVGAEALVRWQKKDGMIPPNKFIPIFEKNKFIIKLDLYIFERVCKDIATWKKEYKDLPVISVNISKENFIYENFIDRYVEITDKYNIERKFIELEITETSTSYDKNIIKILTKLKKKGFMISIDDFGTGTSSLSMLQNMPIDIIKIDKAFIDNANLTSNENLINYIEFIAKKLGVKTIVEGVETKEQVDFICKLECDMIQGYYYSKPISRIEFEKKYLKEQKK